MNMMNTNRPAASAVASLGNLSLAQVLHERICLLYLRLEGCPKLSEQVAIFSCDLDMDSTTLSKSSLYMELVDALCAFEEVTSRPGVGGKVHPVNDRLAEIEAAIELASASG